MSDNNVCPICGRDECWYLSPLVEPDKIENELQSEIVRLKAELEKALNEKSAVIEDAIYRAEIFDSQHAQLLAELEEAERKIVDLGANLNTNRAIAKQYAEQRNEARKWARYFYWMWRLIK